MLPYVTQRRARVCRYKYTKNEPYFCKIHFNIIHILLLLPSALFQYHLFKFQSNYRLYVHMFTSFCLHPLHILFLFSFRLVIITYNLISSKIVFRTQTYKCNNIIIRTVESFKLSKTIQTVQTVEWNKTIQKSQSIKWNKTIQISQSIKWNTTTRTVLSIKWKAVRTVQSIKWNKTIRTMQSIKWIVEFRHHSPSSGTNN